MGLYPLFCCKGGAVRIAGGREQRQFYNAQRLPGHAAALRRESTPPPNNSSKSPGKHSHFFLHVFNLENVSGFH